MPRYASDMCAGSSAPREDLFACWSGIDAPIREIHERLASATLSAIEYHFGSKHDLIEAVIDRHALSDAEVVAVRADLRARRDDRRSLVDAIVRRIAGYLGAQETRDYVRIVFQLLAGLRSVPISTPRSTGPISSASNPRSR